MSTVHCYISLNMYMYIVILPVHGTERQISEDFPNATGFLMRSGKYDSNCQYYLKFRFITPFYLLLLLQTNGTLAFFRSFAGFF